MFVCELRHIRLSNTKTRIEQFVNRAKELVFVIFLIQNKMNGYQSVYVICFNK